MNIFRKTIAIIITVCFLSTTIIPSQALAQGMLGLPVSGTMVSLSPVFTPTILRGIRVYPNNSLKFDFIVDVGDEIYNDPERPKGSEGLPLSKSGDTGLAGTELKNESEKLIKYFLAALTIPEDNLWVNLSPHEQDRIIPDSLAQTDMGTDMLSQDYLLKQITASLIYPEDELGKQFWQEIYKKAYEQYGTTNIPVDTFNKVWIMPDKAEVYVKDDQAFVVESKLKVMLETDYLALEKSAESRALDARDVATQESKKEVPTRLAGPQGSRDKFAQADLASAESLRKSGAHLKSPDPQNNFSKEIVREIILPALEKEVNAGKNFAKLRQIYNSLILAYWFKHNLKESIVNKVYSDQEKIKGVDVENVSQDIYNQYVESFKKGVCDFIKVEYDQYARKHIPRKYFSGGVVGSFASSNIKITEANSLRGRRVGKNLLATLKKAGLIILVSVGLGLFTQSSVARTPEDQNLIKTHTIQVDEELNQKLFSFDSLTEKSDFSKNKKELEKEGGYIFDRNFSSDEEINKRYGFPPNSNSLKALKKLSKMGLDVLNGENGYSNDVPAWQVIALSKEPEVADAIAQENFEQFYYRINDTIFGNKGFRKIEDLLGACDLYNHFFKHQDDKEIFYSLKFKNALNYLRTKFPDLQISTESAVHILNLARNFDEKETKKIVTQFEASQGGQEIFINDLFILDYCRTNPRFYHFLFNRKDLEKEVLSTIYKDPQKDRESGAEYKRERLSPEDIGKYPTLFLLRSLLVYEFFKKDNDFKDQIIRQIARIYYQDEQDQTTEYGGYLSIKNGKLFFNLQAGYSHNNDSFSTRDVMMPVFADFHLHPFDVVDGEIIQKWSGPSEDDFNMSIKKNTGLSQGFVFSAFSDESGQIKINIDTYIGDYFFKPFFYKFPENLNLDLGIISLPDNQDSFESVYEYSPKDLKRIKKILKKFRREEINKRKNTETTQPGQEAQNLEEIEENDIPFEKFFIDEDVYYINLADSIRKNPEAYTEETIKHFSEIAPFFGNKDDFKKILKNAMDKHPDLSIEFWAYTYFEKEKQDQILIDLITKDPGTCLQRLQTKFMPQEIQEELAQGLLQVFERNPNIVFEYADNIVQNNADLFLSKKLGFIKNLRRKTENEKISLIISSLRILSGAKMPFDKEHIRNAVSMAVDLQERSANQIYYDSTTTVINILNVEKQFSREDVEELPRLAGVPENKIHTFKGGKQTKEDALKAIESSHGPRVILFRGHSTPSFEKKEAENYGIDWVDLHEKLMVDKNFAKGTDWYMYLAGDFNEIIEYLRSNYNEEEFDKILKFLTVTKNRLALNYGEYLTYEEIANALSVSGDFSQTRFLNFSCDSYNHNLSFAQFLSEHFAQNPQVAVSEADKGELASSLDESDYLKSIIKTIKQQRGSPAEKTPIYGLDFQKAKTDAVRSKQHPVIFFFPGKQVIRDLFVEYFGEKGKGYYGELYSETDKIDNLPEGGAETGSVFSKEQLKQNPLLAFQISLSSEVDTKRNDIQFGKLNPEILNQGNILGAKQGDTFFPAAFNDMQLMMFESVLRNKNLKVLVEGEGEQFLVKNIDPSKTSSSSILQKSIADLENHPKWKKEHKENLEQFINLIEKDYVIRAYEKTPNQYLYAAITILDNWPIYSKIIEDLKTIFDSSTVGISFSNNTAGFLSATRGMSRVLQLDQETYKNRYLNTIEGLKNSFPEKSMTFRKSFENNPAAFIKGAEALSQRDVTKKSWQAHKEIIKYLLGKVFVGDSAEQALIDHFYFFSLLVRRISKNNQDFWQIVKNEGTEKIVADFLLSPNHFLKNLKISIKAVSQDNTKTIGGIDTPLGSIDLNAKPALSQMMKVEKATSRDLAEEIKSKKGSSGIYSLNKDELLNTGFTEYRTKNKNFLVVLEQYFDYEDKDFFISMVDLAAKEQIAFKNFTIKIDQGFAESEGRINANGAESYGHLQEILKAYPYLEEGDLYWMWKKDFYDRYALYVDENYQNKNQPDLHLGSLMMEIGFSIAEKNAINKWRLRPDSDAKDFYVNNWGFEEEIADGKQTGWITLKDIENRKKSSVADTLFTANDTLGQTRQRNNSNTSSISESDPTETASSDVKGGIDFNAENMNVTTKGDSIDFNIPLDLQNITSSSIEGFVPIIINITPITNFNVLLGLDNNESDEDGHFVASDDLLSDKQAFLQPKEEVNSLFAANKSS